MRDSRRSLTETELLAAIDAGWDELHARAVAAEPARSSHVVDKTVPERANAGLDPKTKGKKKRGRARNTPVRNTPARPRTA